MRLRADEVRFDLSPMQAAGGCPASMTRRGKRGGSKRWRQVTTSAVVDVAKPGTLPERLVGHLRAAWADV